MAMAVTGTTVAAAVAAAAVVVLAEAGVHTPSAMTAMVRLPTLGVEMADSALTAATAEMVALAENLGMTVGMAVWAAQVAAAEVVVPPTPWRLLASLVARGEGRKEQGGPQDPVELAAAAVVVAQTEA